MDVEIRLARPIEYPAVGDLIVDAYQALGISVDDYADELRDIAHRAETCDVLVAEVEGALAGTATYVPGPGPYAEVDDPDAASIRMLAVDPAWQGRGIGRALVEACLARARAGRRRRLLLHTQEAMVVAARLYGRLGFTRRTDLDWDPVPGLTLLGYGRDLEPEA